MNTSPDIERPDCVTDAHLKYLDGLRATGITNMFDGARFIERDFDLDTDTAKTILVYWMKSYKNGAPELSPE